MRALYSEKLLLLPFTYQARDATSPPFFNRFLEMQALYSEKLLLLLLLPFTYQMNDYRASFRNFFSFLLFLFLSLINASIYLPTR